MNPIKNLLKPIVFLAMITILAMISRPPNLFANAKAIQSSDEASVIQAIRERDNTLIAGVKYDFKPFGFLDDSNQVVGFDVDLIQAMADEWEVEVEFVQVTSADRIPKLAAGEVDIVAASMTHKKERDEEIDFSQTYFLDGQSLLVRQNSGIEDISGLEGKTVAAIAGSTSIEQIETYAEANGVNLEVLPFQEYPPALAALKGGQVDALTTDSVALNQFAQDDEDLIVVGGLFTEEPYGMGVPAGDSHFAALVNFTLQNLKEDGTYDELYQKWFGEEAIPYDVERLPGEWPYTFADSPTTLEKPDPSIVEKLLSDGTFVAGVKYDFAPFGFLDEEDEAVQLKGFDVDIMREFAKRWLKDENAVEFVQVTSADRIPKLAAGEVDILAASMTHNKPRDETIDFSQTYFLDGQSLLVRQDSDIQGVADLEGKTIAAIQGSTSIDNIQAKADELGITIEVLPFLEYPQALEALKAEQIDALTTDSGLLSSFAQENEGLLVVGETFTSEPYGLGVPNYDDAFRDLVNFTLQEMKADGTYDALYRKWFGEGTPYPIEIWPGEPADPQIQDMIAGEPPVEVEDSTAQEEDSTAQEDDSASEEGDSASEEGDSTTEEGDSTTEEGDSTAQEEDSTAQEEDSTAQEGDSTAQEGDSTTEEGDSTAQEGDSTTQEGDSTAQEEDSTTEEGDSTTEEGDSTTQEGDSTAQEEDSTTEEEDSAADGGDSTSNESDSTPSQSGSTELPTQHTVVEGDILSLLAERFYNNAYLYRLIYNANADVIGNDPDYLRIGSTLKIPQVSE